MNTIYYVYVIQSEVDGRLYVGLSENIEKRLKEHNTRQVFSTKGYRPWKLVYKEKVRNRQEARKREKYFKSGSGKEYLKEKINNSEVAQW
ncbi:MAG TPA: GIY-YIG nuclease family protein [Patescibacteria group bacterium]|nr:GIY-YIG nuclease family protein [Patescibacteria group bacterium]